MWFKRKVEVTLPKPERKLHNPGKDDRFYLYMFKPGQLMVGLCYNTYIPKPGSCDWYYLTKQQTAHYLKTGELPHYNKTIVGLEHPKKKANQ